MTHRSHWIIKYGLLAQLLAVVFLVNQAWTVGTTTYVSLTGSDANTCGQAASPSTPLRTIRAPFTKGCVVSGDTVWILAGTYTDEPGINEPAGVTVPNGTAGAHTIIRGDGPGSTILRPPNAGGSVNAWRLDNAVFVDFKSLTIDMVNVASPFDALYLGDTGGIGSDVLLEDVELMNAKTNGVFFKVNRLTMRRVHDHHNGQVPTGFGVHGFYAATGSNNTLIEYSEFDHNGNTGVGGSSGGQWNVGGADGLARGVIYRYNYNHDNARQGHAFRTEGAQIYRNIFANNESGGIGFWGNNTSNNKVYNNTVVGSPNAVQVCVGYTGCTGNLLTNNHLIATSTVITGSAAGYTSTTNRTTGLITDCTVSPTDFTQKVASACRNAGTPISGQFYNESNPDQGWSEVFTVSSATMNETFVDVTFAMNGHTPLTNITPAGFALGCSGGVNCGTPIVSTASLLTGSSSVVRLGVTGMGGTGVCEVGQLLTLNFNSAQSTMTDAVGQKPVTFTSLNVTNNCGTAPPSDPGTPVVYLPLNDNTGTTAVNSGSGGATYNGTLVNSPTWVPGKHGFAVLFSDLGTQKITVAYGSGFNPTTQSLTMCVGMLPIPGTESFNRVSVGVPLGAGQRWYIGRDSATWGMGIQGSGIAANPEFPVAVGWAFGCIVANKDVPGSGTGTATLYINAVKGASAQSVKTYTNYTFSGPFELGTLPGFSQGGVTLDEPKFYEAALTPANIQTLYDAWEPPSPPASGTLASTNFQVFGALTIGGTARPMAALNTNAFVAPGGWFTYAHQTDCTVTACSALSEKVYYSCALCPSAGAWLPVPDVMGPDQFAWVGASADPNLLTGTVTGCLDGALTPIDGGTQHTSSAVPVFTLAQDSCVVQRGVFQVGANAGIGWKYCIRPFNQTGGELTSYTPPGGGCVEVRQPSASGFASLRWLERIFR